MTYKTRHNNVYSKSINNHIRKITYFCYGKITPVFSVCPIVFPHISISSVSRKDAPARTFVYLRWYKNYSGIDREGVRMPRKNTKSKSAEYLINIKTIIK